MTRLKTISVNAKLMETPQIVLAVSYWAHMFATVVWIGELLFLAFFVYPILPHWVDSIRYGELLRKLHKPVDGIAWTCLALLVVTGLLQMSASPNYLGFLSLNNLWSKAILFKHIAFLGIILISAIQTWRIAPAIERASLLNLLGKDPLKSESDDLLGQRRTIVRWNFALSILVIAFTAMARVV